MIKNHPSYYQFLVSNYCLPTLFDKEPKELFTLDDVKGACFEYIEGFYNTKRSHSALNFLSPIQFENNLNL